MIWLAWRRHRLLLLLFAGGIAALILWMLLEGHAFELAQRNSACTSAAQPGTCLLYTSRCV